MSKSLFLTLFFVVISVSDMVSQHKFKRFGLEDGLSNLTAECFCQDYLGYMWIGSSHGLNRYDGYNFTTYFGSKHDSLSLADNQIFTVYEDRLKNLWIGSYRGLQLYNRFENNFTTVPFPDGQFSVKSILHDSKGNLWIGTNGGSLYLYSYQEKRLILSKYHQLKGFSIVSILEDKLGNIWLGTENNGVFIIEHESLTSFDYKYNGTSRDFSNSKIRSIVEDANGNIWLGSYGEGIYIYNPSLKKMISCNDIGFPKHTGLVMKIINDSNNQIWVGIDGEKLINYNPKTHVSKEFYSNDAYKYSISSNSIRTLYEDKQHNLWVGAYYGGISVTKLKSSTHFNIYKKRAVENETPPNNVTSLLGLNSGNLLIGTDGDGLYQLNRKDNKYHPIEVESNKSSDYSNILALFKDKTNIVWVGYYRGGLRSYNSTEMTLIKDYNAELRPYLTFSKNDIRDIKQDKRGKLIIGTNGDGVLIFDVSSGNLKLDKSLTHKLLGNSLPNNYIRTLYVDSKNFLWIGSIDGLSRYNFSTGELINITSRIDNLQSIPSNNILHITETSKGVICIGTTEGLSLLDTPVWSEKYDNLKGSSFIFKNYTVDNGLSNNSIASIIEDDDHNLWIGTEKGLSKFDLHRTIFKHYSTEEFSYDVFNKGACLKDLDGKVFFGSVNGIISFYPDSIGDPTYNNGIAITDIKLNYESILKSDKYAISLLSDEIEITHNERALSFEFSAFELFYPNEIKFQYKLDGFDDKWNTTDASQRFAQYTNLNPGTYKFMVKSTNYQGEWLNNTAELEIVVLPPFWQRVWFRLLVAIFTMLTLYLLFVIRVNTMRKTNKRLELLISMRTKELVLEQEKQKQQEVEKHELILKQKELETYNLKAEKELFVLKNEKLQHEINSQVLEMEKKNSELISLATQITQKIEFISKLKNNLLAIIDKANLETKNMLNTMVKQIERDNNVKKDWEQFEHHFNIANNNFFKTLKESYPELTPHDLKICGYLRMNLSNKEIAVLQNISIKGVDKSRFRLRKKFQLESEANIIEFLLQI